jgi:hypothetical protein
VISLLGDKKLFYDQLARKFLIFRQLPFYCYKTSGYESLRSSDLDIIFIDSLRSEIGQKISILFFFTVG